MTMPLTPFKSFSLLAFSSFEDWNDYGSPIADERHESLASALVRARQLLTEDAQRYIRVKDSAGRCVYQLDSDLDCEDPSATDSNETLEAAA